MGRYAPGTKARKQQEEITKGVATMQEKNKKKRQSSGGNNGKAGRRGSKLTRKKLRREDEMQSEESDSSTTSSQENNSDEEDEILSLDSKEKLPNDLQEDKDNMDDSWEMMDDEQKWEAYCTMNARNRQLTNERTAITQDERNKLEETPQYKLIKSAVKNEFRTYKFLTTDSQRDKMCRDVATQLQLEECSTNNGYLRWHSLWCSAIVKMHNSVRNYYCTRIRNVLFEKWLPVHGGNPPSEDLIMKIVNRTVNLTEDVEKELFMLFWDDLVTVVTPGKSWTGAKRYYNTLSESTFYNEKLGKDSPLIPCSTEAFIALVMLNNIEKWTSEYELLNKPEHRGKKLQVKVVKTAKAPSERVTPKFIFVLAGEGFNTVHTQPLESGQVTYGGWSTAGVKKFAELHKLVKIARAKASARLLEQTLLVALRDKHLITFATEEEYLNSKKRKSTSRAAPPQEVDCIFEE